MTVAVDIINSALTKLGQKHISSLTEDNDVARICHAQYLVTRDMLISSYNWNFSLKRDEISKSTQSLPWGDANVFDLPQDCIRVCQVLNTGFQKIRYMLQGRNILSTEDTIYLLYGTASVPESFYGPYFKEALSTQLAHDLCYKFTNSAAYKGQLMQEKELVISRAMSKDSQEIGPEEYDFTLFTNSRMTGVETDYYHGDY